MRRNRELLAGWLAGHEERLARFMTDPGWVVPPPAPELSRVGSVWAGMIPRLEMVLETPADAALPVWAEPGEENAYLTVGKKLATSAETCWLMDGYLAWLLEAIGRVWPGVTVVIMRDRLRRSESWNGVWAIGVPEHVGRSFQSLYMVPLPQDLLAAPMVIAYLQYCGTFDTMLHPVRGHLMKVARVLREVGYPQPVLEAWVAGADFDVPLSALPRIANL